MVDQIIERYNKTLFFEPRFCSMDFEVGNWNAFIKNFPNW
jgi:hypothetical protein